MSVDQVVERIILLNAGDRQDATPNPATSGEFEEIVELQEAKPTHQPAEAKPASRFAKLAATAAKAWRVSKAKVGEAFDRAFTLVLAMVILEGGKTVAHLLVVAAK
jgi:hypothetical protein